MAKIKRKIGPTELDKATFIWSPKQSDFVARTRKLPASLEYFIFRTRLGYVGIIGDRGVLVRLIFGYRDFRSVETALATVLPTSARLTSWNKKLMLALTEYAAGKIINFSEFPIKLAETTPFTQAVIERTHAIAYGQQMTYGQLAEVAGYPHAARAVGNVMRDNPMPLVVPCHRVVRSGGAIGAYSAPGGGKLKRQLLEMEYHALKARSVK